jgi:radical SAM protein with 4Fe4S-binding SPASM domain
MVEAANGVQEFQDRLTRRARSSRRPFSCIFELTPTCNLRCHFCYVALDPYTGPYLSTEQVVRILDTLQEAGILWLVLTGGEILTRRDFPEIYRAAKQRGFLVTLFTNATMMNERIATILRDDPPFLVEVSLYGADAEHYESSTGIPGSFARFERGIEWLRWARAPLVIKTPVTTFTEDHVPTMKAWCNERGLPYKLDLTIDARHDGGQEPVVYRITPRKVKELGDAMDVLWAEGPGSDTVVAAAPSQSPSSMVPAATQSSAQPESTGPLAECSARPEPGQGADELYQCGAGRVGLFVDGLGNASHCIIDREPSFPILEMSWGDIWQQMGDWVTQPLPKTAACSGCDMRRNCQNCPARSKLATGSHFEKDTYYCDVTHAEHGLEPADHSAYMQKLRPLGGCAV